jgi:hypothetical protein
MNEENKYTEGTWIVMEYGFDMKRFYVAEVAGNTRRLSHPSYLTSDGVWMSVAEIDKKGAQVIGVGKPKRYWRWLPWREGVVPFHYPVRQTK